MQKPNDLNQSRIVLLKQDSTLRNLPPLMIRAFGAHGQLRTFADAWPNQPRRAFKPF
jgi:hypothetical protein